MKITTYDKFRPEVAWMCCVLLGARVQRRWSAPQTLWRVDRESGTRLAAIAQPRRDPVHRQMNPLQHVRIAVAGSKAREQFDLHVIERIHIGKAVADRAREQRIAFQQRALPGDGQQRLPPFRSIPRADAKTPPRAACGRRRGWNRAAQCECRSWPEPCPCSKALW